MDISIKQAKEYLIHYHHLASNDKLQGKNDIINYFKKVGCIQYDPIDIVGNNPNLVLQSRVKNYNKKMLDELLYKDRLLIDGWDKCMSIYLVDDYPYLKRHSDWRHEYMANKLGEKTSMYDIVLNEIETSGPKSSKDLNLNKKVVGPWGKTVKLSNALLESLYFKGDLIVYNRKGNTRSYDLISNHISSEILEKEINISNNEWVDFNILRRINSIGLLWNKASDAFLGFKISSKERRESFGRLINDRKVMELNIEGIKEKFYISYENIELLNKVIEGYNVPKKCVFLAPLDNILWDRKLIKALFDFEYIWEIYKPAHNRKYGYYTLPILYGTEFIGRFQPKYNKDTKQLEIADLWFEDDIKISKKMINEILISFRKFGKYLGANEIILNERMFERNI